MTLYFMKGSYSLYLDFHQFLHLVTHRTNSNSINLYHLQSSSSIPTQRCYLKKLNKKRLIYFILRQIKNRRPTSISIVNSNSSKMIEMRVFFDISPSFVGQPPNATNASTIVIHISQILYFILTILICFILLFTKKF